MEIAIVGSDDFVTGFQLAGLRHTYVARGEKIDEQVNSLIEEPKFGILVMEDRDVKELSHLTKKRLDKTVTPVIVSLSIEGKEESLREMIKKSVGVDLWK